MVTARRATLALALAALVAACSGAGPPDSVQRSPQGSAAGSATSTTSTTTTTTTTSTTTTTRPLAPRPGAASAGDALVGGQGNGGYDVTRYDVALRADPGDPAIAGIATITATALHDLASFNLDLHGFEVTATTVDGAPAANAREGDELTITPAAPIAEGRSFSVQVRYHGVPQSLADAAVGRIGWLDSGPTSWVAAEPEGAKTWFPANDHPRDKAAFRVAITVPSGVVAIAGGVLTDRTDIDDTTTFVYTMAEPVATYLASVAIGDFELTTEEGPHGIVVRHAIARPLAASGTRALARTAEMIGVLEGIYGPYPFSVYGALIINERLGYALENQTLSLFERSVANAGPASERVQVHELAHQWFGNSISLDRWSDIWLNEGFATYAEWLWLERTAGLDIDAAMRNIAARRYRPIGSPTRESMFDQSVYQRGALTLHALRRTVGDDKFFVILRDYVAGFRHRNVTTADFVALSERVSGVALRDFFDAWLNAEVQPALP